MPHLYDRASIDDGEGEYGVAGFLSNLRRVVSGRDIGGVAMQTGLTVERLERLLSGDETLTIDVVATLEKALERDLWPRSTRGRP